MPSAISAPIPGSVAALYMRNEVQVTLNPEVRMKLLVKIAEPTEQIKQDVPIQRLLRTMLEMVRLGNLYFGDKDYEKAFIYYLRFMTILVETLPKHPGYDVCYSEEKRKVADIRTEVADRASEAKKRVKEVYEKESVALRERLENMRKKEDEETKRLAALAAENNQNPILSPTPPISNRGYDLDSLGDLVSKQETPLKHVLISCDLVAEFLKAASSNTLSNVETCAILSGKLERDSFVITHAILPKQQGDSDSCETLDEHEVYEYQERHGLISLGWIHTHPSQTAFLSSIDLHMQNSFQMLLDESIAIVCAPSRPQSAIYTLTKYGREVLTTCRKTGHHPHDNESKLYEEASHYRYLQGGDFKMRRSARIAAKTSPEAPKGGHKKVAQQGRTPPKRKSLDTSEVTLKKKKLFGQVEEPGEASVNEESDAVETKLDSNGNVQSDSDDSIETSGSEFEDVDTEVSEEFEDPDVETVKKSERPKGKSAKAKEPTVDKEHFAGLRKFTGKGNLMHDAHVSKPKAAPSEQPMANHHFSEGSEDEWEDVDSPSTSKPLVTPAGNLKTAVPKMDVTIVSSEQQKIKERLAKEIQLEINREKKQAALAAHDVILLCNVAHLRLSLKALLSEDACFVTLCRSLIPKGFVESLSKKLDILILKKFMKWFGSSFVTANDKISAEAREKHKLGERMELLVENKCFETSRDLAAILFGCFVSMHILSRFGRAVAFQKEGHDFELVDDDSKKKKKKKSFKECRDYFVEFWSCEEQRWIAVDPKTTLIDCPFKTAECFSPGFLYALAIDNKFGVRDVSARYAEAFLSSSFRRRRTGAEYLKETLRMAIFAANRKRGKAEDMEFHDVLSLRPMPTTLADFKNHPLYALEKDLLKFEAIYPKDEKPLGTVRGHNVYARSAVRRLEGELFWLRQGRCVKKGEEPFKVVKARPDISVPKEEREDRPLPLYGHWQTHDFVPPVVGPNDPVPRNEYDNIYMYKPSMLPKGCVHLKQPGIEKIAKKLQIDHVQAVVGWDFHCGKNHVILEGIVAHTKNEEVLVSAWTEDRIEHLKKVELQTKKRIYGNWRRMITGAIRLNAIRAKFGVTPKLKKKDEEASEETLEEEDVGSQKQWPATDFTLD